MNIPILKSLEASPLFLRRLGRKESYDNVPEYVNKLQLVKYGRCVN